MAETLSSLSDLNQAAGVSDAPRYVQKLDKYGRAYATGKRKNAVARVWIKPGSGKVTVNGRDIAVYFARPVLRMILQQPLVVVKRHGQYDLVVSVAGGGLSGRHPSGRSHQADGGGAGFCACRFGHRHPE